MIFSKEQLNKIREKVDYFEFYQQYMPDLRVRGRNAWATCVLHRDTKPSLQVNLDTGTFRCWGCNVYGDIFTFYKEFFNVPFTDAVRSIAEMYNVEIEVSEEERKRNSIIQSLQNVNKIMCNKFQENLHGNLEAWNYLTKIRGLSPKIIDMFKLGVGIKYLPEKEGLKRVGLLAQSENMEWYSKFRDDRIIFPRFDEYGNIVSFTGRLFVEKEGAKYMHTSNTEIYNKSENLFGLYFSKKYIKKCNSVVITEGNIDFLKLYQKGILNSVALDGLNISDTQVNLLKKYTSKFYIVVEDKAMLKTNSINISPLETLYNKIIENIPYASVYIIDLRDKNGDKCDPDMYLSTHSGKDFEKLMQDAKIYNEYVINSKLTKVNPKNIEEKTACINYLIPKLANIQSFLTRKQYIELVSNKLLIPENDIYRKVKIYIEKQDKQTLDDITYDSRPVFIQKILLSMCFAPNFNNYSIMNNIILLAKEHLEPFYKNILINIIQPYIISHKNDEHIDFTQFFSNIMYSDDIKELERKTILDIYLKTEQLEDFTQDDVENLLDEQINILKTYKYCENNIKNELDIVNV